MRIITKNPGERLFHQWKHYLNNISGIIYIIDASDPTRFIENKQMFESIINMEEFKNLPVAVLGNKIEKMTAVS
jgi:GTP-binding protein SAR1